MEILMPVRRYADPFGLRLFGADPLAGVLAPRRTLSLGDVRIAATEHGHRLDAILPGVRPERIALETEAETLSILVTDAQGETAWSYRRSLPAGTDADAISASLENGVLTVELPRSAAAAPRRIAIATGTGPSAIDAGTADPA